MPGKTLREICKSVDMDYSHAVVFFGAIREELESNPNHTIRVNGLGTFKSKVRFPGFAVRDEQIWSYGIDRTIKLVPSKRSATMTHELLPTDEVVVMVNWRTGSINRPVHFTIGPNGVTPNMPTESREVLYQGAEISHIAGIDTLTLGTYIRYPSDPTWSLISARISREPTFIRVNGQNLDTDDGYIQTSDLRSRYNFLGGSFDPTDRAKILSLEMAALRRAAN